MRIAFVGSRGVPARYSGFETCVEQVGSRMVQRGHEVTVFCRGGRRPAGGASGAPTYLGMTLRHTWSLRGKHTETLSHTALAAVLARQHDAIVCMGVGNAPVVRVLQNAGRRIVFNVDGADWQRDKWSRGAAAYLRAAEVLAARSSATLVADSHAVQDYYLRRHGRDTGYVAYGAEPPRDRGTGTPERLGVAPGNYVLFVGRLEPENGAHDLASAVRAGDVQMPAVVVGDAVYPGAYVRDLRASAPPGVIFAGFQFGSAYQQLSAHAAVFVLAARVGGTHPVLLEQMAAGNCILAFDTPSNREVLGDAGLWWRTPQELAGLLGDACGDPGRRRELGERARRRQQERYDWEEVTTAYLRLCGAE